MIDSPELLAPAGDPEKLKIAVAYGADAVYFGAENFSLRAGAGGFTLSRLEEGVAFAHKNAVSCYLTLNIYAHQEDLDPMRSFLRQIRHIPIDAFIVSDPGVAVLLKKEIPDAVMHLSTQANVTNSAAASFWYESGFRRLVLARELSLDDIRQLRSSIPKDMELEAFVHGAMCISYSGRCLISNFMTGRDANRGECAHPCRYRYHVEEEQRPGQYWPVEEDERGTYIFNSKDLCMLEHIPELAGAGIASFKIEGRMKSIFYLAHVLKAYRRAIDAWKKDPASYCFDPSWHTEMQKASHRRFCTGFYFGKPSDEDQDYESSDYVRESVFLGLVKSYDPEDSTAVVEQRNKICLGDRIEFFGPEGDGFTDTIHHMLDENGDPIEQAPHPKQIITIRTSHPVGENWMLRKENPQ